MPSHIYSKGRIGVVSRSGTLNYEAVSQMTKLGLGQSTCVGIGGDPVNGTDFKAVLHEFENDDETDVVVIDRRVGGQQEVEAARWSRQYMSKPLVAFIAGVSAPRGRRMGHAGAVISGESDTATAKLDAIEAMGHHTVRNPADIGDTVLRVLKRSSDSPHVAGTPVAAERRTRVDIGRGWRAPNEHAAVLVGRWLGPALHPDERRPLPYEPPQRFVEAGDARVERPELERPIDVLADRAHHGGTVAAPLSARERRHRLDVPRRQSEIGRMQLALDHGSVRHDPAFLFQDEVHAAERVREILLGERGVLVPPGRVEEVAQRGDLLGPKIVARDTPHDRHEQNISGGPVPRTRSRPGRTGTTGAGSASPRLG